MTRHATVSLSVNTDSWGPETENLRLEGVVHLEGSLSIGISVTELSIAGGGALVGGGLLGVVDVLLLDPDTAESLEVEVGKGDDCVANEGGLNFSEHFKVLVGIKVDYYSSIKF